MYLLYYLSLSMNTYDTTFRGIRESHSVSYLGSLMRHHPELTGGMIATSSPSLMMSPLPV